jgi:outer membrane protein OmpA-like peptidoglycan-associated protein
LKKICLFSFYRIIHIIIMKEKLPLNINIPKPCNQNWDAMAQVDDGKHCTQCNNLVYDFSQMTDNEVLEFFKQKPTTHCGRFHNSQLNSAIVPVAKRRKLFLTKFNKVAAAFFTVLSFKNIQANAAIKNTNPVTVLDANFKSKSFTATGKIVVSGTIKGFDGQALEKATVMFDSIQVATTDAEGKFSFELDEVAAVTHNLYFNYDDLITAVRSYHPAMLSTNYDVTLNKKREGFHTMGVMKIAEIDLPSLVFKNGVIKLTNDQKAMLIIVAQKLKENPDVNIEIVGYPLLHGKRRFDGYHRVENIKKYLVEKQGISAERIITNLELGGDSNTVDIK